MAKSSHCPTVPRFVNANPMAVAMTSVSSKPERYAVIGLGGIRQRLIQLPHQQYSPHGNDHQGHFRRRTLLRHRQTCTFVTTPVEQEAQECRENHDIHDRVLRPT
jgi:hypothetical protein